MGIGEGGICEVGIGEVGFGEVGIGEVRGHHKNIVIMYLSIFARKIALVNVALMSRCWQAIADSHTPASGRNVYLSRTDKDTKYQDKLLRY